MMGMKKVKSHSLQWFINRIGKQVYRKDANAPLRIQDVTHAKYLEMIQNDLRKEYQDRPYV